MLVSPLQTYLPLKLCMKKSLPWSKSAGTVPYSSGQYEQEKEWKWGQPAHSKIKSSLDEAFFLKTWDFSKCCILWQENMKSYLLSKSLVKFCSSDLVDADSFNLTLISPETRAPQKPERLWNTALCSPTNIIKAKGVRISSQQILESRLGVWSMEII